MTLKEAQNIIDSLSYKPGHAIDLHPLYGTGWVELRHIAKELDSTKLDGSTITTGITKTITSEALCQMSSEELMFHIKEMLKSNALHEVDEWFKLDGRCVTDPHPELNRG